ncbi:organic cation/carnitine transporter 2-like [Canna indica]|uniref:H(+)/Pi cotransporter n=1 Tax=Canna indica TaxID=4628 RepID=A0AAQ3L0J5_9LILI|nr:organic cation/carnitine transporter 2-like [Canna indica]
MVDTVPLLPHRISSEIQVGVAEKPPPPPPPTLPDLRNYDGSSFISQLIQVVFVSLAWAFDAQQIFINIFTDAAPAWHCIRGKDSPPCPSSSSPTPCGLPPQSWAWDLPVHVSVISEWSLQCSSPLVVALPATALFVGCLAGGFLLATLADSMLGRKNMLVLSCLTMSLSGVLTAASPNVWVYSAFRFLCGFGRSTVCTTALVLLSEITGEKWRGRIGVVGFVFFTLGFLSLPAIAYANRSSSWRTLYLWISIPSACYSILIHFLIQESPRWLSVRDTDATTANGFSSIKMLWERRWTFNRLTAAMIAGFGIGMVYTGMPLNVGNLGSNIYLSTVFNALAELPSSLVTFFLVGRMDRRCSVIAFTTLCGVCNLLCVVLEAEVWRMAAEVVSFFSVCTAFDVFLIYGIELFPTCVRNSAMSVIRQAIVLGGAFAPLLVALGRKRSFISGPYPVGIWNQTLSRTCG